MAEVVNLRLARKAKARSIRALEAEASRALHGESKAVKATRKAETARAAALLDGAKRERD